ncbi:ATP-binding cassette domain-containing protein [Brevibacillus laterosporus]
MPEEKLLSIGSVPKHYLSKDLCLQFERISFTYDGQKPPVLHNLHFELKTGRHIALVGPSGGGKSTIVKLLCGLYVPNTGHFQVKDDPSYSQDWDAALLRSFIAYVPQDVFLFLSQLPKILPSEKKMQP